MDALNDIKLRKLYAYCFLGLIIVSSFMLYFLLFLIGKGILFFDKYVQMELIPLVFLNTITIVIIIVE